MIYLLAFAPFLVSCNQGKTNQNQRPISSAGEPTQNPSAKTETKSAVVAVNITPLKPEMTITDIEGLYFVSDTIKNDFSSLIGTVDNSENGLPTMQCTPLDDGVKGLFEFDDSTVIIPFWPLKYDLEVLIFTKWRRLTDTTFSFSGRLYPDIGAKYTAYDILERAKTNSGEYLIGASSNGEGGKMRQYIWTAKFDGTNLIDMLNQYEVSYFDGEENRKTLSYKRKKNVLSIIMHTDSTVYKAGAETYIPLDSKIVKTVVLK